MVKRRQRGFSFAEVMIATALLATLGSSLMGGYDHERVALAQGFDQLQAQTAAQSVFETLRADRARLEVGERELEALPKGLHGTRTIEAVAPGLFAVRVRIEGGRLVRPYVLETRLAGKAGR